MHKSLHSTMVEVDSDEAESHMGRDFLAPHPDRLTTKRSTFKAVNTTTEKVEGFMIVAGKKDVRFHSARKALNELLDFVGSGVGRSIIGVEKFNLDVVHNKVSLFLAEMVVILDRLFKLFADYDTVVILLEEPHIVVSINAIMVELVKLSIEFLGVGKLLAEPDTIQLVDVSRSARHSFKVVARIQNEVWLYPLEVFHHILKEFWLKCF